jgi:hypothetical protein
MPKFFVCEEGPMGGCNIVAVFHAQADAMQWVGENGKGRNLYVYHQIFAA